MIGSLYFAHDAWRFPVFYVPKFSFPEGANIIFSDSIPLFALFGKIIYKVSGQWMNYFGLYIVICFPLLAAFVAVAAKQAGTRDPLLILGAALLALASPALLIRFGHVGLMAHFLIAWGIFSYYKMRDSPSDPTALAHFCFAIAAAVLLQAYFAVMVFPFLLAALAQAIVERRASLRLAVINIAVVTAVALTVAWGAGAVGPGNAISSGWGFGHYSMNLRSPLLPPRERLPEFLARRVTWDGGGRTWDATGGQYDGYNYLGAGLIFLAVIQLTAWKMTGSALKRHTFLALLACGFFVYAMSNRVFLGDWLVLEVRLPEFLTRIVGQFRTGGRYFWPVYYILVVALVLATSQRFRPRAARILILTAVILQLADTHFLRQGAMAAAAHGHPQELKREEWRPLLAAHRFLVQYPSFQCGGWAGQWPDNNSNMELLLMAAQMDMPSNSAYLSRLNRNCEKEMAEGQNFEIADGGLYIFARRFPIHKSAKMPSFEAWCREFRYGIACSRHWDAIAKTEPVTSFRPVSQDWIPQYSRATKLKFSAGGNGLAFLGGGWSIPEPWGIWSLGGQSEIALRLSSKTNAPVRMSVSAVAFVHAARPSTSIEVFANGRQVATWAYVGGEGTKRYSLEIPESLIPETGVLRLTFVFEQVQSPKQAGISADPRELSLGLIDLTVSE